MQKIKFNNDTVYDVKLYTQGDRIVCVFKDEIDVNSVDISEGFVEINEHNHIIQADYSDYKYIYKKGADNVTYVLTTDKDDVYVEPEIPDVEDIQSPEYIPTIEDVKRSKISILSSICNKSITDGVDINIDGNTEHFSYKDEDQVNIKEIFDLAVQTNTPMYYHADGKSCKLYTVEQVASIYTTNAMNKMHHITYFNQLKMYVESLDDKEIIDGITYGDELTGEYLETYNAAMSQAKLSINKALNVE